MTTTPIKTLLLSEIKNRVAVVIGEPTRVFLDPARGLREEMVEARKPYANIFTDGESSEKKDLSSEKSFGIEIHTWVKDDTDDKAREKATLLSAQIQAEILPRSSTVRQYCQYFEEARSGCCDILLYDEGLCVVVSRYDVKYRHAYGNPFSMNPY